MAQNPYAGGLSTQLIDGDDEDVVWQPGESSGDPSSSPCKKELDTLTSTSRSKKFHPEQLKFPFLVAVSHAICNGLCPPPPVDPGAHRLAHSRTLPAVSHRSLLDVFQGRKTTNRCKHTYRGNPQISTHRHPRTSRPRGISDLHQRRAAASLKAR